MSIVVPHKAGRGGKVIVPDADLWDSAACVVIAVILLVRLMGIIEKLLRGLEELHNVLNNDRNG